MKSLLSLLLLTTAPLCAEPIKVVTDIAPVHGLVASVMQGVGQPTLIVPPEASPHGYAMRPSQARALQDADVAIWVGPELTPWLEDRIATLAPDALTLALLATPGSLHLPLRIGEAFEVHDHEDDHVHGHDGDEEETDPHAWLAPENAALWLDTIAAQLSQLDPENATLYQANATAARVELAETVERLKASLKGTHPAFLVFHDAYQYFEESFALHATAAVSLGDAAAPGPARIAAIRDLVQHHQIACAYSELQFDLRLLNTVLEGSEARIFTLDPMGRDIPLGPDFYPTLLTALGASMTECFDQKSG